MRYKLETIDDARALLRRVARDYLMPNEEDDDITYTIKQHISALPDADKVLFILYTEVGSYRQIGKVFGVSRTMVLNEIKRITNTIRTTL
jgi:DNA-directed RNA polymerase specialized sigma subunit